MKDWLIIILIFLCAFLLHQRNNFTVHTDDSTGTEPYYYYTVGYKTRCYLAGEEITVKEYQKAIGFKEPDGKAGWITNTTTTFFNAQKDMGL